MSVTQAGPNKEFYLAYLRFPDFAEAKRIIISAGKGLITWDPPPYVKPQSELAPNEKPAKDDASGWRAYVLTDTLIQEGAHITILLVRPQFPDNKTMEQEMPLTYDLGDTVQSQLVYYKIAKDTKTTKSLLKSLDQLRPKNTPGDQNAEMKRAVLCGRDQTQFRMVDLLEGLTDNEIDELTKDLTPSQNDFIRHYCRNIFNGIGILQGPAGSGKTTIIKVLMRIAVKRGQKVAIICDANSAADNVVRVIADPGYIAVRVHSLGKY